MKSVESEVKALLEKAANTVAAHEAMQFTQAALNAAHAYATLTGAGHLSKQK